MELSLDPHSNAFDPHEVLSLLEKSKLCLEEVHSIEHTLAANIVPIEPSLLAFA